MTSERNHGYCGRCKLSHWSDEPCYIGTVPDWREEQERKVRVTTDGNVEFFEALIERARAALAALDRKEIDR